MHFDDIEQIEITLLLETLYQRYGYDFRQYAPASVRRRVHHIRERTSCERISDLIPLLLHDEKFAKTAMSDFSIIVTSMFRDPTFYQAVRQQVVPYLRTFPFVKIWTAGCATGEEVYSLAILLHEEGLLRRCTIFATDLNEDVLNRARDGIYPLEDIQQHTQNYQAAGGKGSFSDYYHAQYGSAIISPWLKRNITFANHNLVTDRVFCEAHLIFCRNVLIYFNQTLQNQVLHLLTDSLHRAGVLCLGNREALDFSEVSPQFKTLDSREKIYQKRIHTTARRE